jgi:hypothetical protein
MHWPFVVVNSVVLLGGDLRRRRLAVVDIYGDHAGRRTPTNRTAVAPHGAARRNTTSINEPIHLGSGMMVVTRPSRISGGEPASVARGRAASGSRRSTLLADRREEKNSTGCGYWRQNSRATKTPRGLHAGAAHRRGAAPGGGERHPLDNK